MEVAELPDRINALERHKEEKKVKLRAASAQEMMEMLTNGGLPLAKFIFEASRVTGTDVYTVDVWYHYHADEHRWKVDKKKMSAHALVSHVLDTAVLAACERTKDDEVMAARERLKTKLGNRAERAKLVCDMEIYFHDALFVGSLDADRSLVVFKNGVWDGSTFRQGLPSDRTTLSTNTTFIADPAQYGTRAIHNFLSKILPAADVLSMVLSSVSLALRGVRTSRFFLWVGCGSNGKSVISALFRMALGEYAVAIPVSLFTQKRAESGRAMPELSRTGGRRVAFISEPSHNETLNLGIVKEVTGGDAMFTRGLYESGSEITCNFVPILLCNVLPSVTDTSHGAWRRLVSVTFPTLFVESPIRPNEKRLDPHVDETLEAMADLFSTLLATGHYITGDSVSIPKECLMTTDAYKTESDFYAEYIHERIIHTGHDYDECKWTDIWCDFYAWFVLSYGRSHIPKKAEAKKKFTESLNPRKSGRFVGYLIDRSK
jgi:phage/plasmid-associated DNA primase